MNSQIAKEIKEIENAIVEVLAKQCKDTANMVDPFFQSLSNKFKTKISTVDNVAVITDRNGIKVESEEIHECVTLLIDVMVKWYGTLWCGKEYYPVNTFNENLSRCVVIVSQEGDWEGLYIDGDIQIEGHKIDREVFLDICLKNGILKNDITTIEASDLDDKELRNGNEFPKHIYELKTDYDFMTVSKEPHEDVKEEKRQCIFEEAWRGRCKNDALPGETVCLDHINVKCACGKQATHNCEHTMGALICGRPLCDSCRCNH